jgi:hypothetical protein
MRKWMMMGGNETETFEDGMQECKILSLGKNKQN